MSQQKIDLPEKAGNEAGVTLTQEGVDITVGHDDGSAPREHEARNDEPTGFEAELRQLESKVNRLEQGDLALGDALGLYEEGVALTRQLQETLVKAEQKVKKLSEEKG